MSDYNRQLTDRLITTASTALQNILKYHRLTNSLVNRVVVIECDVSKASQALGGSVLNQVDVIHMSKLREVLCQDQFIGRLLQPADKNLTNTNLILTMQWLLNTNNHHHSMLSREDVSTGSMTHPVVCHLNIQ